MTLRDGYRRVKDGECWLENVHIAQHGTTGSYFQHDEVRPRRLLLHKREIVKLKSQVDRQGLTIVPMACYFNEQSRLKVNIALARGKGVADKRETIRRRESDRENRRMLKVTMSAGAAAPDAAAPPHVVFLQNFGQGHVLPTVPLVAALRAKGCAVTYFAESDGPHGDDLVNEHTMLGKAVVAAGATLRAYADFDPDLDPDLEPRLDGFLNKRWRKLPGLLADLRALEPPPAVVVYDPFVGMFPAAATVLGLPHVSLVPHSGPGSMASVETPKKLEQAAGVRGVAQRDARRRPARPRAAGHLLVRRVAPAILTIPPNRTLLSSSPPPQVLAVPQPRVHDERVLRAHVHRGAAPAVDGRPLQVRRHAQRGGALVPPRRREARRRRLRPRRGARRAQARGSGWCCSPSDRW